MTKISNLNKAALQSLRSPIEDALKAFGESTGLILTLGSGTYSPTGDEASFKLILKVDDPALQEAAAREKWNQVCRYIGIDYANADTTGLRPEDFGTTFTASGTTYRTTGIAAGRSKYPVQVEVLSGPKAGRTVNFDDRIVATIRKATDAAKVSD